MGRFKNKLGKTIAFHYWLTWIGAFALLSYAISGITHPLMTWTGPRAAAFFPPQIQLQASDALLVPKILERHGISRASVVRVLPSEKGAVLQVTQLQEGPRRYFDLKTGDELTDYDQKHAVWLARYYTGQADAKVQAVHFQRNFDDAYPWVNRLLPIYRITFEGKEGLTAFVHTETNALGNLTNDWKTALQSVFRNLHSWSWLESWEFGRIAVISILLLSIFGILISGLGLILFLRRRRSMPSGRHWHRLLASIVWLPLFAFAFSGSYHLLHSSLSDRSAGLRLSEPFRLDPERFGSEVRLPNAQELRLNGLSVVEGPGNRLYYRLSVPQAAANHEVHNHERFKGVPQEQPAIYVDALKGEEADASERDFATYFAERHRPELSRDSIVPELVTQFGSDYDFRNKRLPVWRISAGPEDPTIIFVDTATGILVDQLQTKDRREQASFSQLHKWNFLVPFVGRVARDVLAVAVLLLAIALTAFGLVLRLRRR